jgi:hypothetical protein
MTTITSISPAMSGRSASACVAAAWFLKTLISGIATQIPTAAPAPIFGCSQ